MTTKNEVGRTPGKRTPQQTTSLDYKSSDARWIGELQELVARHSHLGVTPDLAALTLHECWGVYCFLKRIEEDA